MKLQIVIPFLFFVVLVSCQKEEIRNDFQITKILYSDSGIVIQWDTVKMENFVYYEVLRSTDGKSFYPINTPDINNSKNINKTTYLDHTYPFKEVLYYKVAAIGKGEIVSDKVEFKVPQPYQFTFKPTNVFFLQDNKQILFLKNDWSNSYICLFDYQNNRIVNQKNLIMNAGEAFGVGKYNSEYEFYLHDVSEDEMQILGLPNFDKRSSFRISDSWIFIISDNKGYLYYPSFDYISLVNRSTITTTQFYLHPYGSCDEIHYSESLGCIFGIDIFDTKLLKIGLNNGSVSNISFKEFDDGYIEFIPHSDFACLRQYFNGSLSSIKIINLVDWSTYDLVDENKNTIDFSVFCANDKYVYATGKYLKQLYCYSIGNNMTLDKVIPIRVDPKFMFIDDTNTLLLIENIEYNNQSRIDRMKVTD